MKTDADVQDTSWLTAVLPDQINPAAVAAASAAWETLRLWLAVTWDYGSQCMFAQHALRRLEGRPSPWQEKEDRVLQSIHMAVGPDNEKGEVNKAPGGIASVVPKALAEPVAASEPDVAAAEPVVTAAETEAAAETDAAAAEPDTAAEPDAAPAEPEAAAAEPDEAAAEPDEAAAKPEAAAEPDAAAAEPDEAAAETEAAAEPDEAAEPDAAAAEPDAAAAEPEAAAEPDAAAAEPEAAAEPDLVAAEPEAAAEPDLVAAEPEAAAEPHAAAAEPESAAEPDAAAAEPEAAAEPGLVPQAGGQGQPEALPSLSMVYPAKLPTLCPPKQARPSAISGPAVEEAHVTEDSRQGKAKGGSMWHRGTLLRALSSEHDVAV
ncbi:protein eyes shut-like, partial [Haematococcus lacustris]